MKFSELQNITSGKLVQLAADRDISHLVIDSRRLVSSHSALFIAIRGERHDAHRFIQEVYDAGMRQFLIESQDHLPSLPEANIYLVANSASALQDIAAHHRNKFQIPVIGITGSNGKTIVKEWLSQAVTPKFSVAKSPGSYNSQIGVPLSIWGLQSHHTLGIFEAGISRPGEMQKLQAVIRPTIGIFTNLGSAHDEGFKDRSEKLDEKLKLFSSCEKIIFCHDQEDVAAAVARRTLPHLSWGFTPGADIRVEELSGTTLRILAPQPFVLELPFSDTASRENALHVAVAMIALGFDSEVIRERITQLHSVPMRLEVKQGMNRSLIIDDTYNNDLAGLAISLDFLRNLRREKKTMILSDVLQAGTSDSQWISQVNTLATQAGLTHWYAIGPAFTEHRQLIPSATTFADVKSFVGSLSPDSFQDMAVLVKGARVFGLESIVQRLQQKVHGTVMQINLAAMVHNLNLFRSRIRSNTRIMAMVKAFAYGSGSEQVANLLQFHRIDYLGVAYADEGVDLRKANITVPIMVMNPTEESYPALVEFRLEPEVYSLKMLRSLIHFLNGRKLSVHLKFDTGMHRLGIEESDLNGVLEEIGKHPEIIVQSVFSHLAGADESAHDNYSMLQADLFARMSDQADKLLGYHPMRHLLNSPGILRLPQYQFDMVRLGIGLYGIDPTEEGHAALQPVSTLRTVISQVRKIPAGSTVGYGRRGKAEREMKIATVAIGYADGYSRAFSRGVGKMLVGGKLAPVIGNVCMDMTMLDISDIDAKEGDDVIVFGDDLPITKVASWINTIPYELLTQTSERVRRVFATDSF